MSKYVISMCDGESHEVMERYDEDIFDTYEEAESTRDESSAGYANGVETAEERAHIAQQLESIRYRFWLPKLPLAAGGWSWRVVLESNGENRAYYFGKDHITVNGLVYFVQEEQLDELRAYVEP